MSKDVEFMGDIAPDNRLEHLSFFQKKLWDNLHNQDVALALINFVDIVDDVFSEHRKNCWCPVCCARADLWDAIRKSEKK